MNGFGKFFTFFLKVCEFLNSFSEFWSQFCWNFRTFDTLYRKLDKFLSNSCKNFRFPCFWASLNLLGPRNSCEICRKLKKGPEPIQKPTKFQKILKNLSKSFKNSVFFEKSFENFQKLTKTLKTPVVRRQVGWERWMALARAKNFLSTRDGPEVVTLQQQQTPSQFSRL